MLVKVWNDNTYPYSEKFRGKEVVIEAGKFVEMEYDQAIIFKGTMNTVKRTKDGGFDPRYFKRIRVEEPNKPKSFGPTLEQQKAEEIQALKDELKFIKTMLAQKDDTSKHNNSSKTKV